MKTFFNPDGPIYGLMTTIMNMFIISMCWIIGSIPIVTIGVSTVAAFDVGLRMVDNEEGYVGKQFIKAYKSNFRQGLFLGTITLIAIYSLYIYAQVIMALGDDVSVLMILFFFVAIFIIIIGLIYAYPITARYVSTVPKNIRNSARIAGRYPIRTLLIVALIVIEVMAFLCSSMMQFIGVLLGPASLVLTVCLIAKPIFKKIEKQAE